jgi:hypothetical protein
MKKSSVFKYFGWIFVSIIPSILVCSCNSCSKDGGGSSDATETPIICEPRALQYCVNSIAAENKEFVVYSDFGDGRIQFTQKALLNPSGVKYPEMNEKATSEYGVTCIHASYPLSTSDWNGYLLITGKLDAGSTSPQLDFGDSPCYYDLSGAKRLTFKARGATGKERLRFYVGGLGGNDAPYCDSEQKFLNGGKYVTLTADWQEYSSDLANSDLTRIACGFGWVTSQVENTELSVLEFDLDDIVFQFDSEQPRPLFLRSYASLPMDKSGAFINNFAYTYDNALLAIALAHGGFNNYAAQVADALAYCVNNDRYYAPGTLRNAYANGYPESFPGWRSSRNASFAMLPGFYNTDLKIWYEDRYAVSINTGIICWAIEALLTVYEKTHKTDHLDAAVKMADYVVSNFSSSDAIGGFTGGYEGWEGNTARLGYKSTEHNIDLVAVFKHLTRLLASSKPTAANAYLAAANNARDFVLAMYDSERGCFYTGTLDDGVTVNTANLPLDANTWAILALYGDKEIEQRWNPEKVYSFILNTFATGQGFDYNADKDGIWAEGTAQAALAALQLGKTDEYNRLLQYLNSASEPDGSICAATRDGLTTGFDSMIATDEGLKSIPWTYDHRVSLGSTMWLALAQLRINPYTGEKLGE